MKPFSLSYDVKNKCLSFVIQQDINVDELLCHFHIGRKQRYFYYQQRLIQKNDVIITQSCRCQKADIIKIHCMHEDYTKLIEWDQPLDVCYEDEVCLIVNKPSGILVHSDGNNQKHTLHNIVQAYYNRHEINVPVRAIHRLDMDTSGLLFYCKLPFFQAYFDALLETKQIARVYYAWAEGVIQKPITIEKAIARDRHQNKMRVSNKGASAETKVVPLLHHQNCTFVECHLKSGRTHQIRVHLSSIHHPLLSDLLYGHMHPQAKRLALHAGKLQFTHPITNKTICVICPLPQDMPYLNISRQAQLKIG